VSESGEHFPAASSDVLTGVVEGIAVVMLNRPDRSNALSPSLVSGRTTAKSVWGDLD
jgi:enoyl-CoA hydratase/carnithine racemase